jgi:hypothetical protein
MTDALDRLMHTYYGAQADSIDAAAERAGVRIERERKALRRPDGSPVYAPAEMQEREQAILEAAGAEFDGAVGRYVQQADDDIAEIERRLAILDGFDPFDSLSDAEKQAAATRAVFVREDVERLPSHEVAKLARAALASKDRPRIYLFGRYHRPAVAGDRRAREDGCRE